MKKKNNNFINNTTREAISININKINNNKNDFFLKANSNISIYKNNQIRNERKLKNINYTSTNKLLNEFISNINKNEDINSLNKSIQFSEREKAIINDEIE